MSEYYTILTDTGIAKFVAARASGNGVNLAKFKISQNVITPSESISSLEAIVYEANINSKSIDESNPNYVNIMCHVPSSVGGFEINSIGIYDEAGDLIAVGNLPKTYKPRLDQGSAKELAIKVVMELSNADEVILKLDPSVVMASRKYVDEIQTKLNLKSQELEQKLTNLINSKRDKVDSYTKKETDNLLNAKLAVATYNTDKQSFATKTEVGLKADKSTTYTKTEVDTRVNAKANANAVVALTGNQTIAGVKTFSAPPVSATNPTANNQVANKAYVDSVMVNQSYLKQKWGSNLNGWRLYSDNWCEQWGYMPVILGAWRVGDAWQQNKTITLYIPYIDTNYNIQAQAEVNAASDVDTYVTVFSKTTTNMEVSYYINCHNGQAKGFYWRTYGYV